MMDNSKRNWIIGGTLLASGLVFNGEANAENLFQAEELGTSGHLRTQLLKAEINGIPSLELTCGESSSTEHSCGEGSCGEGSCGEATSETSSEEGATEHKCGEGQCGGASESSEEETSSTEHKCGEGSCGL